MRTSWRGGQNTAQSCTITEPQATQKCLMSLHQPITPPPHPPRRSRSSSKIAEKVITLTKNGNLQLCQNYRTISLISHPSKDMLKIILNRLKPEAEKIIAEEQAGIRPGRSTAKQIFNLSILCERYLQHQQDLYHVFIDFKKAFDRVWHAALWATMRLYSINTNLINAIQNVYDKATSAVCFNGSTGGWFRTTVRVRQGCLLSPTLFNIFLKRNMADALEDHKSTLEAGQSQTCVLLMT